MEQLKVKAEFIGNGVVTTNTETGQKTHASNIQKTVDEAKNFITSATAAGEDGIQYDITVTVQRTKLARPKK